MHQSSVDFMNCVKLFNPNSFKNKRVLDVGSQDINGNNRYLFENCIYVGLDLGTGLNVDVVSHIADYQPTYLFDTIISTNALEHDKRYKESFQAIAIDLLKSGGLFAFSCASHGSIEHGTTEHYSGHSPHTNDHYKNLDENDVRESLDLDIYFSSYNFQINVNDLQFWGIRK